MEEELFSQQGFPLTDNSTIWPESEENKNIKILEQEGIFYLNSILKKQSYLNAS